MGVKTMSVLKAMFDSLQASVADVTGGGERGEEYGCMGG